MFRILLQLVTPLGSRQQDDGAELCGWSRRGEEFCIRFAISDDGLIETYPYLDINKLLSPTTTPLTELFLGLVWS